MTDDSGRELDGAVKQLTAMRLKHGADSAIGRRCSNVIEQLGNLESNDHNRGVIIGLMEQQMAELERLTAVI